MVDLKNAFYIVFGSDYIKKYNDSNGNSTATRRQLITGILYLLKEKSYQEIKW